MRELTSIEVGSRVKPCKFILWATFETNFVSVTWESRFGDLFGEALSSPQLLLSFGFLHSFEDAIQDGMKNTGR